VQGWWPAAYLLHQCIGLLHHLLQLLRGPLLKAAGQGHTQELRIAYSTCLFLAITCVNPVLFLVM